MTKKKIKTLFADTIISEIDEKINILKDNIISGTLSEYEKSIPPIPPELINFIETSTKVIVSSPTISLKTEFINALPLQKGYKEHIINLKGDSDQFKKIQQLQDARDSIIKILESTLKSYTDFEAFMLFPELTNMLTLETKQDIDDSRAAFDSMLTAINNHIQEVTDENLKA